MNLLSLTRLFKKCQMIAGCACLLFSFPLPVYARDAVFVFSNEATALESLKREKKAIIQRVDTGNTLPATIEQQADNGVTRFVFVNPPASGLAHLPLLYPDLQFIWAGAPLKTVSANVQTIAFDDEEAAFLAGIAAGVLSKNQSVATMAADDTKKNKMLAYAFFQGAKYSNAKIEVSQRLSLFQPELPKTADVVFMPDGAQRRYAALPRAIRIIGLDTRYSASLPKVENASLIFMRRMDLLVSQLLAGQKMNLPLNVNNGLVDYQMRPELPTSTQKELIDALEAAKEKLARGQLRYDHYSGYGS